MERISNYLKEHHPHYQHATIRKLYDAIRSLKQWPYLGRPGREEGTRELAFSPLPHIAVYRLNERASKSSAFITVQRTGLEAEHPSARALREDTSRHPLRSTP